MKQGWGFVDSFSSGNYVVFSPTGKTRVYFDESERFGPSKVNLRTGDLSLISDRLSWFWDWYANWREAGRPTVGKPRTSDIGEIQTALGPQHYARQFSEPIKLPPQD